MFRSAWNKIIFEWVAKVFYFFSLFFKHSLSHGSSFKKSIWSFSFGLSVFVFLWIWVKRWLIKTVSGSYSKPNCIVFPLSRTCSLCVSSILSVWQSRLWYSFISSFCFNLYRRKIFLPILLYWRIQFQNLNKRWYLCIFSLVKKEMSEDLESIDWGIHLLSLNLRALPASWNYWYRFFCY